ncbi:MAG: RNA-binding protein [Pseudomonadota bacterium]
MANKSLFRSTVGKLLPKTDTLNRAGAPAYAYGFEHALAQLAMTGTFNEGFYGSGSTQVADLLAAADETDPGFVAQTAIYARSKGYMKDTPAVLLAVLSMKDPVLFGRTFGRVVDNGKMLRNFVQIMRSGAVGRKSLGTAPKRQVQAWLNGASDWQLLNAAVGNDPSLADVIKMVHPKPETAARAAFYAWIMGKPCDVAALPKAVQTYIRFKETGAGELPDVPFQMLTALPLDAKRWAKIAERGSWQMVRMNLNTFARHGVFGLKRSASEIAAKLRDPEAVRRAKAMPYQLMATANALGPDVPKEVREALFDAMEIAVSNASAIDGSVVVAPDVSGSMQWPVTGYRRGATSAVRCVDVAGLVAAAMVRTSGDVDVMPFDTRVHNAKFARRDSVLTNAQRLAEYGGGGTDCTVPLRALNSARKAPDLVIFVSDNQSWAHQGDGRTTPMMAEWNELKRRNPAAKLVCIDIAPYGTTQAAGREDILNVGGFSDQVFDVIARFAKGENGADYWVRQIKEIEV